MSWPPASDYQDAVQNPQSCFQDGELKAGHPVLTRLGLPRVASGNFACVFEIRQQTQRWAVRCFLRQAEDQQDRYARLSQHLGRCSVSSLVPFGYLPAGIRVRGEWYPIVRMAWVEGAGLHTYVEQHLQNSDALWNLATQWRSLLDSLRRNQIAHGDLQHGNVLVTAQGQLRLVDYDGMFVPALHGQPSSELGHPNYQHPQRSAQDFDERLDNFAALVIYTSLLALSAEPGLWRRYHSGENLIFSAADFRAPAQSALFQHLHKCHAPLVRALAEKLTLATAGTMAQVPEFKAVDALTALPRPEPWWREAEVVVAHASPAHSTASAARSSTATPRASVSTSSAVSTPTVAKTGPSSLSGSIVAPASQPTFDLPTPGRTISLPQSTKPAATSAASRADRPKQKAGGCIGMFLLGCFLTSVMSVYGLMEIGQYFYHTFQANLSPPASTRISAPPAPPPPAVNPTTPAPSTPPAQTTHSSPATSSPTPAVSPEARQKAQLLLNNAQRLQHQGFVEEARKQWQEVIVTAPGTPESDEARQHLNATLPP